ncbi:hypothetical protein B0H10DRAFT_1992943 [Mycena sp. CBHHK59/15]|nr:hypothetical protein B0H10DRAFT_1992943 [Mycena sp. CBHHK59/15]
MASFRTDRASRKPYSRPAPRTSTDGQWLHDMAPTGPRASLPGGRGARLPGALGLGPSPPNSKLVVSNLHYDISAKDLMAIFGQIGTLVCEPHIRYDRSGRSAGSALVTFETPAEATRAKKQFDGILAKGQPMAVAFDTTVPRDRAASAPTTSSLLNRIQKAPLLDRLSKDDSAVPRAAGPIRTRRGGAASKPKAPNAAPKSKAPAAGNKDLAVPTSKKVKAAPKTAAELDQELDAFMAPVEDVEMAA